MFRLTKEQWDEVLAAVEEAQAENSETGEYVIEFANGESIRLGLTVFKEIARRDPDAVVREVAVV